MADYKFIKDFTYKTGSNCPEGMIGCMPEIIVFKKGDILGGLSNNLSNDGKNIVSYRGNYSFIIPIEYVSLVETKNQSNNWMGIPMVTCPDGTKDIANGIVAPCVGKNPYDLTNRPETFSKVLCNDGTTELRSSNPLGRVDVPCRNKGGIAQNQPNKLNMDVLTAEDKLYEKLGVKYHNSPLFGVDSRLKGRLLVIGVLVVGYLAYKKYKK